MENVEMGTFLDSEIASLCNIFTLEQPNFVDEFLGHSTPFVDKNEYIYDDPSNFLPLTNQNHFSFHYDSISNTEFSDNASDSTTYNNPSQTTIDSHQNSHFSSPSDAFFPMMNQENNALLSPDFLTEINVDSFPSFHEGNLEDNTSHNLGSPSETEVPLKRKHNNTLASNDEENQKVAAPKKRSRVSKDRGNNCIEAMNYNTENHIDAGEVENSDDGGSKFSEQASEGDNSSLKEISKGKKKRASRGEATDPQSLYARRRRERINERLRILQQLVPNGTKVDISTMLEQALHYVKFLQLQIRILSSDDLWMYAPMACNGVDLSLYKRISPFLLP